MTINSIAYTAIHTECDYTELDGENVLRVVKKDKLMSFDENTYAKISNTSFHNGEIEVKMLSRLLPDAPDFARGFIGVAFRINEEDTKFEAFYVRPTNGQTTDPVRKNRGVQYFSYPNYTFDYFRNRGIVDFEGPADIALDKWITLKIIVIDEKATFYLNNQKKPVLVVDKMKLGAEARGNIGLFVDIGTEAFFKELIIKPLD
ncbi:hypothetical protein [Brochothrix thermosphacta]|uniref:hypothetical protein n=1 Tax=Brochothrix thermosphacta TaxID=2756 RepID=UPI000D261879|nr:hypothetical protein [Brochothrix thermosphacta]SOC29249.1 conserved hypothetical protein [Brochothrix thermosphacta]